MNQHPSGTRPRNCPMLLIPLMKRSADGVPIGADRDPTPKADSSRYINATRPVRVGSRLRAASHRTGTDEGPGGSIDHAAWSPSELASSVREPDTQTHCQRAYTTSDLFRSRCYASFAVHGAPKWHRFAVFPPARSRAFSAKPDLTAVRTAAAGVALAAVEAAHHYSHREAFCRLLCVSRYNPPGCREDRSGNIQDHRSNLLGDDVMDHVPGIGHLA